MYVVAFVSCAFAPLASGADLFGFLTLLQQSLGEGNQCEKDVLVCICKGESAETPLNVLVRGFDLQC